MAQRVQVKLVDDLNGEEAQETVRFGVDGTEYEIDLTTENAEKLRSSLSEYVEKGRKAKTGKRNQKAGRVGRTLRLYRRPTRSVKRRRRSANGHRTTVTTRAPADVSPSPSSTPTTKLTRTSLIVYGR